MRKLPVAAIAIVVGALGANMLFTGCGSDTAELFADSGDETGSADGNTQPGNDTGTPGNDGGAPRDGSFVDAITEGGRADAATCKLVGQDCTGSTDCCTANCDATSKKCAAPVTQCKAPGATCATGNECCTFSCTGGTCANKQCVSDNGACGADTDCCGGRCAPDGMGGGTCTPLNTTCKTSGNACGPTDRCCSGTCNGGVCASTSFCVQNGDVCSSNFECCGGSCIDTSKDASNCGACGTVCSGNHAAATCVGGACKTGACNAGWGDCNKDPADGCEVDTATDSSHCGSCDKACPGVSRHLALCRGGVCVSQPGRQPAEAVVMGRDGRVAVPAAFARGAFRLAERG